MATNEKISELNGGTPYAAALAADDLMVMVDVSDTSEAASGTTKSVKKQHVFMPNARTISSGPGTQTLHDDLVFLDPTSGAFTFNLLAAATWVKPLRVKNIADPSSSANNVTLDGDSSELIDFATTYALAPGETLLLVPRGSKVEIIGR